MKETKDLLRLDTSEIIDPAVASSFCCAEEKGIEQFKKFVAYRLVEWSMPILSTSRKQIVVIQSTSSSYKSTNILLEE